MQAVACSGPDQGYAWVVAVACFCINFITAGLNRTAGVLYVALIDLYGVSREAATTPFSIRVCIRNMAGPIVGILGQRYGVRSITAIGGVIAGLGCTMCFFAPNIFWITVFWGVIHGLGFGLATVLHMMRANHYFDKYKATALGIGFSGDCFGSFVFPVLMEYLILTYGLKGTFLILGGVVLHVIPLALLLKKPPWLKLSSEKVSKEDQNDLEHGYNNEAFSASQTSLTKEGLCNNQMKSNISIAENNQPAPIYENVLVCCHENSANKENGIVPPSRDAFQDNLCHHDPEYEAPKPVAEDPTGKSGIILNVDLNQTWADQSIQTVTGCEHKQNCSSRFKFDCTGEECSQKTNMAIVLPRCHPEQCNKTENALVRKCISNQILMSTTDKSLNPSKDIKISNSEFELPLSETQNKPAAERGMLHTLLLTNIKPMFIAISLTMAAYAFMFIGVMTVIIDYAADLGISREDGKYLIIGFSVTDLIGRLGFGQVIDRKWVTLKNFTCLTLVGMGAMIAILPLNSSFMYMMTCMCMYGLIEGGNAITFPLLIGMYTEKHEESVAMGSLSFTAGLLMLPMAPMIGFFRDNIGSYDGMFYIVGGICVVIGLMWQLEPLLLRYQRRNLENSLDESAVVRTRSIKT